MCAVALVAVSCVLAIHMGLVDAVGEALHYRFRIISCTKCLTFWSTLVTGLLRRHGVIVSVATAFLLAYLAMWLDLALAWVAGHYNRWYEKINAEADEADEDSLP